MIDPQIEELKEVYKLYTGHPPSLAGDKLSRWENVILFLSQHGHTIREYLHWCTHWAWNGFHPEVVEKTGYVQHPDTLKKFSRWRAEKGNLLPILVANQRKNYERKKQNLSPRAILLDKTLDMSPAVRCDLAVRDMKCPEDVLVDYEELALHEVEGLSTWRSLLKHWKAWDNKGES